MKGLENIRNFDSLYELVTHFDSEAKCSEHLAMLRWDCEPKCPSCSCNNVRILNGKRIQYKCYACLRKFSVKTGSIFHNSKLPLLKWFIGIYILTSHKRGVSSHQLARDVNVSQKTAWFMLHRIREILKIEVKDKLDGVVQVDETYVGGEITNKSNSKRSEIHKDRIIRGSHHKTPVVGMIDEDGQVRAESLAKPTKANIKPIMQNNIEVSATIVTDGSKVYRGTHETWANHHIVKHDAKQFVNNGFHTNSIENFWSHFKRMITATYFHTKDWHIDQYVQESAFRYNTRDMSEGMRFDLTLANSNKTISWNELVGKRKKRA